VRLLLNGNGVNGLSARALCQRPKTVFLGVGKEVQFVYFDALDKLSET
jgi:hypothetical protein